MAYLLIEEFKSDRDIEGHGDDTVIEEALAEAQSFIDSYCNRTFEGTAEDRTFDASLDIEGGVLWVYVAGDLASIVSITNGNGDTVAASEYVTEPRNAVARGKPIIGIRLKTNSAVWWRTGTNGATEDAITVNGIWAYSATAPAAIVRATKMLAGFYYDQRMSSGAEIAVIPGVSVKIPTGTPAAVRGILANYVRESF